MTEFTRNPALVPTFTKDPAELPPNLQTGVIVEGEPLPEDDESDPSEPAGGGSLVVEPDDEKDTPPPPLPPGTEEAVTATATWIPALVAGIALLGVVILLSPKKKK